MKNQTFSVQSFMTCTYLFFFIGGVAYRIGEITQWLGRHATLAEDQGSVPRTQKTAHKCLLTPVPGDLIPTFGLYVHVVHTHTYKIKSHLFKREYTPYPNPQKTGNSYFLCLCLSVTLTPQENYHRSMVKLLYLWSQKFRKQMNKTKSLLYKSYLESDRREHCKISK